MRELPSAGGAEDDELDNDPADNTSVCRFGLVSEFGLTLLKRRTLLAWTKYDREASRFDHGKG